MKKAIKTITCASKRYKIIDDPGISGGEFHTGTKEIRLGRHRTVQDSMETLLHEVLEVILVERGVRYALERTQAENGDYLFNFNHDEFENIVKDLALAIQDLAIINKEAV